MLVSALIAGCGGREPAPYTETPVDFAYELEGDQQRLAELRGRPVVVVLIRTSEVVSEMYLYEIKRAFANAAGRVRFLVLSLEPSEAPLIGPYVQFHDLPFPIGLAEWPVAAGQSDLGPIPVVPSTYLIGADGRIATAAAGVVPADDLVTELDRLGWR
jgi:hypothetical protein